MNWYEYFFLQIDVVASKSKDKHTKCGCIITDKDNNLLSSGYNSFPRGMDDSKKDRYERPLKYKYMVHAERNAIFAAARNGIPLKGATLYVSGIPCIDCAHAIIQAGIDTVVFDQIRQKEWDSPVYQDHELVLELFEECGVDIIPYYRYLKVKIERRA